MTVDTHPNLEALAAFVDGRLGAGAQRPMVEHLAECEQCYELVAETMQVKEELEREEDEEGEVPPGAILPFSSESGGVVDAAPSPRLPGSRFLLIAASLVVASLACLFLVATLRPSGLVASLADGDLPPSWSRYQFNADYRGAPSEEEILSALRAGARNLDLEVALAREDRESADNALAWLRVAAKSDLFLSPVTYELVEAALRGQGFGAARKQHRAREPFLRQQLENREVAPFFDLGSWAEAGRLAAIAGNVSYLNSSEFREAGPAEPPKGLGPRQAALIKEQLERLEGALKVAHLSEIEDRFAKILNLSKEVPEIDGS